jgi:hypothetical protein
MGLNFISIVLMLDASLKRGESGGPDGLGSVTVTPRDVGEIWMSSTLDVKFVEQIYAKSLHPY